MTLTISLVGCTVWYHKMYLSIIFNVYTDTTFMYVIVGLTIAKLIQIRRPDFHAEGFIAFFSFSVVTLITVISIVREHLLCVNIMLPLFQYGDERNPTAIRVILLFLILVTLAIFIVSLYKFHQWKFSKQIAKCFRPKV